MNSVVDMASPGYRAALDGAALVDESSAGRIFMRGKDRAALLHRLSTSDIARLKLGQFETAAQLRLGRLSQIATDTNNWTRRRQGAEAQVTTLDARLADLRGQLEALNNAPSGFEERQAALDAEIATARAAHSQASDALGEAQGHYREADKAQRLAAEALSGFRENLARVEERLQAGFADRQPRRAAIHHGAQSRPVAFAPGGETEKTAEAVDAHAGALSRKCRNVHGGTLAPYPSTGSGWAGDGRITTSARPELVEGRRRKLGSSHVPRHLPQPKAPRPR